MKAFKSLKIQYTVFFSSIVLLLIFPLSVTSFIVYKDRISFTNKNVYGLTLQSMLENGYIKTTLSNLQIINGTTSSNDSNVALPDFYYVVCSSKASDFYGEPSAYSCLRKLDCEYNSSVTVRSLVNSQFEDTFTIPRNDMYVTLLVPCQKENTIISSINVTAINPGPSYFQHLEPEDRGFWYSYLGLFGVWLLGLFAWLRCKITSEKFAPFQFFLVLTPASQLIFCALSFNQIFFYGQYGIKFWYNEMFRGFALFFAFFIHYALLTLISKGWSVVRTEFSFIEKLLISGLPFFTSLCVTLLVMFGQGTIVAAVIFIATCFSYMIWSIRSTIKTTEIYLRYLERKDELELTENDDRSNPSNRHPPYSSSRGHQTAANRIYRELMNPNYHETVSLKKFDITKCFEKKYKLLKKSYQVVAAAAIVTFAIHTLFFLELFTNGYLLFLIGELGYFMVYFYFLFFLYNDSGKKLVKVRC